MGQKIVEQLLLLSKFGDKNQTASVQLLTKHCYFSEKNVFNFKKCYCISFLNIVNCLSNVERDLKMQ